MMFYDAYKVRKYVKLTERNVTVSDRIDRIRGNINIL